MAGRASIGISRAEPHEQPTQEEGDRATPLVVVSGQQGDGLVRQQMHTCKTAKDDADEKNRFHDSCRQSFSRKYPIVVFGAHMEHRCRKLLDMPNGFPTVTNNKGTVSPINGPETYQGQGSSIHSMRILADN